MDIREKFNLALGYIWDVTGGDDIEYGVILVKHLRYTREELENELSINCGLWDEELQSAVTEIYDTIEKWY